MRRYGDMLLPRRLAGQMRPLLPRQVRTYAVSVSPPRVYPGKKTPRAYSPRKSFLYDEYAQLLSRREPLLFLTHSNFSAQQLIRLRRDIAALKVPPPSLTRPPASASVAASVAASPPASPPASAPPKLTVIRTGILGVVLRDRPGLATPQKRALAKLVAPGPLAVLTLPELSPPHLAALLRTLERAVPPRKRGPSPTAARAERVGERDAAAAARLAALENSTTPGRRPKRFRPDLPPELELKGAMIEGRLFATDALKNVARLPTLDTLRAQLLGLISAPAARLAGVVGEAGGRQLAITLDGFRKGLETDLAHDADKGQP